MCIRDRRLGAWCGHAPELEIDLALANIGLDLLGQARNFLSYAAELDVYKRQHLKSSKGSRQLSQR